MKTTLIIAFNFLLTFSVLSQSNPLRQELIRDLKIPADSIYIEDRNSLEKLSGVTCIGHSQRIKYTSNNGHEIEIEMVSIAFDTAKHDIDVIEKVYKEVHGKREVDHAIVNNKIDGQYAYGIDGSVPREEIKEIRISWNGKKILIPKNEYSYFYNPYFCWNNRPTAEVYLTKDDNQLYLYINGSDGAGGYTSKLIFDKTKFVTSFVSTIEYLNGSDYLDGIAVEE